MTDRADADSSAKPLDDRALVEACLAGDTEAWEALILKYQRLIYSIPSGFVEREARLLSTGALPQAAGIVSSRIEALADSTRRELLSVSAEGLISEASYRLFVDGLNIGGTMVRSGFLRVTLTSDGSTGQSRVSS